MSKRNKIYMDEADDWCILAYADDIFIVAPPAIAIMFYMRFKYLMKHKVNAEFNIHKLQILSLGDCAQLTNKLRLACEAMWKWDNRNPAEIGRYRGYDIDTNVPNQPGHNQPWFAYGDVSAVIPGVEITHRFIHQDKSEMRTTYHFTEED